MKKMLTGILALWLFMPLFAQDNNPHNQKGTDYNSSFLLIKNDYAAGKVTEFNAQTIAQYSRKIPLRATMSADLSAMIVQTLNAPDFNLTTFIQSSNLTPYSQQVLRDVLTTVPRGITFQEHVKLKVGSVKTAVIPDAEKEFVLSMLAIAYNAKAVLPANARKGCTITGSEGSGPGTSEQCAVLGAITGGLIGWDICGFFCALGGAIVGGVIGSLC
jgi:hypothetical protein